MRLLISFILMVVAMGAHAQSLRLVLEITNTWNEAKQSEPVVVDLHTIRRLNFDVRSASVYMGRLDVAHDDKLFTRCQLDDIDSDQRADELVFIYDAIKGGEKAYVTIDLFADERGLCRLGDANGQGKREVYADMMLDDKKGVHPFITALEAPGGSYLYNDFYHHGAAFENELCGFRIYFDARQNIDIYGKRHRGLELADTHFYTTREQMQQGYGNDVLWAGNSVGCGSFKGWDGKAPTNIEPVITRGQRVIASGPVRSIVEVKDNGWNGLNMRQYYTLYAGRRECEVRITFDRPLTSAQRFSTGVQKIGATPQGFVHDDGIAASWGSDYPEMGNKEQFPPEAVGLAVYVPKQYITQTEESDLNYLFVLSAPGQQELKYYVAFCADKETGIYSQGAPFAALCNPNDYHQAQTWFDDLPAWKANLEHPLSVKVSSINKQNLL